MLILATEMVTFAGKIFSGEARFDGVEKKSVTTYFFQDCPDFHLIVFVDLFLSYLRQKKP